MAGPVSFGEFLLVLILGLAIVITYGDYDLDIDTTYELPITQPHMYYDPYNRLDRVLPLVSNNPKEGFQFNEFFSTMQWVLEDGVQHREGWTGPRGPVKKPDAYQILGVDYSASTRARKSAHAALNRQFAPDGIVNDKNRDTVKAIYWAHETLRVDYVQCLYDARIGNRVGPWEGFRKPCDLVFEKNLSDKILEEKKALWKKENRTYFERWKLLNEFKKEAATRLEEKHHELEEELQDERTERMYRDEDEAEELELESR